MLLEPQRGVACAREREHAGDRLVALRVGERVAAALGDVERERPLALRRPAMNACAVELAGADLEVRVARAGQRAGAEERSAQIGAAAARTPDDALRRHARAARRTAESTPASRSTSSACVVDVDVQLVPRRALERAPRVGADLRAHAEVAQERERAPRDRGARRGRGGPRPSRRAGARRPRRGRAPTARQGGSSAAPARSARARRGGRRRGSQRHAFELQQPPLVLDAERRPSCRCRSSDDAVNGQERRKVAAGAERPGGAGRPRAAGERGELAVGHDLPARHGPQRACAGAVEPVRKDAAARRGSRPAARRKTPATERPASERASEPALSRLRRRGRGSSLWKTRPSSSSQTSPTPKPGASYCTSVGFTERMM